MRRLGPDIAPPRRSPRRSRLRRPGAPASARDASAPSGRRARGGALQAGPGARVAPRPRLDRPRAALTRKGSSGVTTSSPTTSPSTSTPRSSRSRGGPRSGSPRSGRASRRCDSTSTTRCRSAPSNATDSPCATFSAAGDVLRIPLDPPLGVEERTTLVVRYGGTPLSGGALSFWTAPSSGPCRLVARRAVRRADLLALRRRPGRQGGDDRRRHRPRRATSRSRPASASTRAGRSPGR